MQVEYSRGYRGLVNPVAIATADGTHAVNPAVESRIEDDQFYIEDKEDAHLAAIISAVDSHARGKKMTRDAALVREAEEEEDGKTIADCAGDEDDYDDQFVDDDSDYRLFRFIDSLPAKIGSYRAVRLQNLPITYSYGHQSRSMDRAKHRRRAL